ncbi:MAG: ribulose-phosphate 3-epimerase [Oscillospiraceae bacterium]|nr:ribulose-phosphate 3-epimerase [Oscillospiraceae bacterium]
MIQISPSILSADFSRLEQEAADVERGGAHMLHIDVMDGHFVPNISFGACVVSSLRPKTQLFFDVHLMISDPLAYLPSFVKAGADMITFHYESESDPQKTIDAIRGFGLKAGMAIKPGTDAAVLEPFLPQLDMALVMTVEPGFGGQKFMADMMPKVKDLRRWARQNHKALWVQVDGGIDSATAKTAAQAGADVLVAGSAVFGAADRQDAIDAILQSAFAGEAAF